MSEARAGFIQSKLAIAAAALLILGALPAWASLGGDRASVDADQVHLQGTRTTKALESYTVHEIQAASGVVVREYVSAEGKVFAIGWNGPWMPDLRQLLGGYFEQYVQAAKAQNTARPGRRPLMIEQSGLVVEVGGHPRAFTGRSYVPEMLPPGVRAEEIR
jgi:Protein of unknown function (DUF2844)